MLEKISPWPWRAVTLPATPYLQLVDGKQASLGKMVKGDAASEANVTLMEHAPDHALLLAAWTRGLLRADRGRMSVFMDGYDWKPFPAPAFDPFGCPILTPELRAALRGALGIGGGE